LIVAMLLGGLVGFHIGFWSYEKNVKTLSDEHLPNYARSKTQQEQDAVMLLKNEIAESGALQFEELESGSVRVSLRVVK